MLNALCYNHAFLSSIAKGLLSYSLTESLIFSYSYEPLSTLSDGPLGFSSEIPHKRHLLLLPVGTL